MTETLTRDAKILSFNPWGYDETDYTPMSDRMVVTRTPSTCAICFEVIPAGVRVRSKVERLNESSPTKMQTFKFCVTCCDVMADDRDGEKIMARYDLGRTNAESQRTKP